MWINSSFEQRRTKHSYKNGLQEIRRERLAFHQEKCKGKLKLVAMDECTMTSQQQSQQVDLRLKETMVDERKFGRRVLVMFGDPAQLPPVMANRMLVGVRTGDDLTGWNFCAEFTIVIKLTEKKIRHY